MTPIQVAPPVAAALRADRAIVALESALITHGFGHPANLDIARRMEDAVRGEGALPATVAVIDGKPHIGLSDEEMRSLAATEEREGPHSSPAPRKISLRDLPPALAQGASGGTTVAATMHLAHLVGISVFATGGIGGVHRDHPEDVSADLTALGSIPLTVICSGAKAILDLPRTREALETRGVPVIGYGTEDLPAFYSRHSGLKADAAVHAAEDVALMAQARTALSLSTALLVCVPVPEPDEIPKEAADALIRQAVQQAERAGIEGKELTPFLLARVVELSEGRAQAANQALLVNNARVAARIARAMTRI